MSSPHEEEDEDVLMRLAEEDDKILEELENVHEDYEKTLEIMQRRSSLFSKSAKQSLDPIVTEIILTRAEMIKLEMGLLNARHELQTDIAKLTSRIDDLESKGTSQ
jgi:hypothetical protein